MAETGHNNPLRFLSGLAPMRLAVAVMAVAVMLAGAVAQNPSSRRQKKPDETYTRPKPTRPIKPEIPGINRFQQNKVFLEQADSLFRREADFVEHQIVKGNVKFRQGAMWMFCDSAYYYPELNSLDAFGHVRMEQGDTLFVYADKLFYNGDERRARLRCGPSERTVRMINRDVKLTTDSLDYDLNSELGWYECGGRLEDRVNVLTSVYGQYSPATKDVEFYHDVVLVNNRDGYRMFTDTLFYNTDTHIARIVSPTKIVGSADTILTSHGWYNTQSDIAELTSRSTIIHADSVGNVTTLEGDSIIYDKLTRISRAYRFRGSGKPSAPVVLTDTANNTTLIGGFAMYNDSTHDAMATDYPMLMEYSRPDTLFLRADTIETFIVTHKVFPPLTSSEREQMERTARERAEIAGAPSLDLVPDSLRIASLEGKDTLLSMRPEPFRRDSAIMVPKDFHVAKAYRRARFFGQDIQGVADSMTFVEFDSLLYMNRKPVVWSGEREIYGNTIIVHLNDSAADWAKLPDYGMMGEHVEEDFYNQLTGREMMAWFENKDLRRLNVSGNVQTIFLPMEEDSLYSRLVTAESSFLTLDARDRKLEHLKMWPEVSGTVTPLFMVKNNQKKLPGFLWLEAIRPRREWYGDRVRWADDLGEVSDELEQYFSDESAMAVGRASWVQEKPAAAPAAPATEENATRHE